MLPLSSTSWPPSNTGILPYHYTLS